VGGLVGVGVLGRTSRQAQGTTPSCTRKVHPNDCTDLGESGGIVGVSRLAGEVWPAPHIRELRPSSEGALQRLHGGRVGICRG
jgi:hypothetical protein